MIKKGPATLIKTIFKARSVQKCKVCNHYAFQINLTWKCYASKAQSTQAWCKDGISQASVFCRVMSGIPLTVFIVACPEALISAEYKVC